MESRKSLQTERKTAKELEECRLRLKVAEERYADFYENSPVGYVTLDREGRIIEINKVASAMLGEKRKKLIGLFLGDRIGKENSQEFLQHLNRVFLSDRAVVNDFSVPQNGHTTLELSLQSISISGDGLCRSALLDISQRKEAERSLREKEETLCRAQRLAHIGNWDWNLETNQFSCSDEIYRIFSYLPNAFDFNAQSFFGHVHADDKVRLEKKLKNAAEHHIPFSIDHRLQLPKNKEKHVHSQAKVIFDESGKAVRMTGTLQDITERKMAEMQLADSLKELQVLADHLGMVREDERKKIGREIHDEFGATLTALKMDIAWLGKRIAGDLQSKAASMSALIDSAIAATRRITSELRPTVLDDLGLVAAIQWQLAEFRKRTAIKCVFSVTGEEMRLPEKIALAVFRVLQEALTNIFRHAKATEVEVKLKFSPNAIEFDILDNGIGISQEMLEKSTSHGIRVIIERARGLGGKVWIENLAPKGVILHLVVPLPEMMS